MPPFLYRWKDAAMQSTLLIHYAAPVHYTAPLHSATCSLKQNRKKQHREGACGRGRGQGEATRGDGVGRGVGAGSNCVTLFKKMQRYLKLCRAT